MGQLSGNIMRGTAIREQPELVLVPTGQTVISNGKKYRLLEITRIGVTAKQEDALRKARRKNR